MTQSEELQSAVRKVNILGALANNVHMDLSALQGITTDNATATAIGTILTTIKETTTSIEVTLQSDGQPVDALIGIDAGDAAHTEGAATADGAVVATDGGAAAEAQ